jgi:peptidoglycan/LPS O-acetylase OafA/YrhL
LKSDRLYEIDFFRFIAALMVLVFHYGFRGYNSGSIMIAPYQVLSSFAKYGYLGVDLFFLISGFVILMTASDGSCKRFMLSRIVRLYPAYWACCTITFLLATLVGSHRSSPTVVQYLVNLSMLNGFIGVPDIDGVYWSLNIEIRFYALIFTALCLGLIKYAEILAGIWLSVSFILTMWKLPILYHFVFPDYSPYFIAGSVFFLIHKGGINWLRAGIAIGSWFLAIYNGVTSRMYLMARDNHVEYDPVVISLMVTFFFFTFLLIALNKLKWLSIRKWVLWGALTYPLYLIHQYVGYMIINEFSFLTKDFIIVPLCAGIMVSLAYLVNKCIEQKYSCILRSSLERFGTYFIQTIRKAKLSLYIRG